MASRITSETTEDEVLDNPKKYGIPTFEEHCKNPEKLLGAKDRIFSIVDAGSNFLSKYKVEVVFKYKQWEEKKLEKLQSILLNEGVPFNELHIVPRTMDQIANTIKQVVEFMNDADYTAYMEKIQLARDWKRRQILAGIK